MDILTVIPARYDLFVGLDVDKKSYSFTITDHNGWQKAKKMPANPEAFYNYLQRAHPQTRILCAYEAGPTGYQLYDYLMAHGQPCLVVSPNAVPRASNERVKTNRLDSKKLAQSLRGAQLKPIRVPTPDYRELRHLVFVRQHYARRQKAAKQQIAALLLFENLPLVLDHHQRWSRYHLQRLQQLDCSPATTIRLDALLQDLEYARSHLLSSHRAIKQFCAQHPALQQYLVYLRSIPGLGFVVATYLLASLGDPRRLQNVREIAAFAGLVPTERSTGDDINRGEITRLGDPTLRSLLIEAAWSAIRQDADLRYFYFRIKNRHLGSKGASSLAIVAVARKLTQRIYTVLTEQRQYIIH